MKKYYHYTQKENIPQILSTKELKSNAFGVFACDTVEDSLKFISFYCKNKCIKLEETVIVEFETDIEFVESFDHYPPAFNNARAVVSTANLVPIYNIKLHDILNK